MGSNKCSILVGFLGSNERRKRQGRRSEMGQYYAVTLIQMTVIYV